MDPLAPPEASALPAWDSGRDSFTFAHVPSPVMTAAHSGDLSFDLFLSGTRVMVGERGRFLLWVGWGRLDSRVSEGT